MLYCTQASLFPNTAEILLSLNSCVHKYYIHRQTIVPKPKIARRTNKMGIALQCILYILHSFPYIFLLYCIFAMDPDDDLWLSNVTCAVANLCLSEHTVRTAAPFIQTRSSHCQHIEVKCKMPMSHIAIYRVWWLQDAPK